MGYVGQHLVSVVTGYPGGKSGARGRDLLLNEEEFAEIKTCYRVDQLGSCNSCQAKVAGIERICPECESTDLKRNDDSKWLIGIRNDDEFQSILEPTSYYLVLFDFDPDGQRSRHSVFYLGGGSKMLGLRPLYGRLLSKHSS